MPTVQATRSGDLANGRVGVSKLRIEGGDQDTHVRLIPVAELTPVALGGEELGTEGGHFDRFLGGPTTAPTAGTLHRR